LPLKRYIIKTETLVIAFISIFIFVLSYFLGSLYLYGDQESYRYIYENLPTSSIRDSFVFYTLNISSVEVVHFTVIYLAKLMSINKDVLNSLVNVILAITLYKYLYIIGYSRLFSVVTVFSNYYMHMLYFAGERLKYGFLFLLLGLLFVSKGNKKLSSYVLVLAIASHVQTLILIFSAFGIKVLDDMFFKKIINKGAIVLLGLFSLTTLVFFAQISGKFYSYLLSEIALDGVFKCFVFTVITMMFLNKRYSSALILLFYIILGTCIAFLGGDRIVIFCFFSYLTLTSENKSVFKLCIDMILIVYYLKNTLNFAFNIITYNNGYYFG